MIMNELFNNVNISDCYYYFNIINILDMHIIIISLFHISIYFAYLMITDKQININLFSFYHPAV